MARFIPADLIRTIADHHDAHPGGYKEFADADGLVLVTREGGLVRDVREILRLGHRITDVIDTLECVGITEAKLVIGDGTRYVIVYQR